ncbi:hypothetical protein CRG98_010830 [Punica granatum]|uniref:Reverse transcriptase Ty1/copia-type domain-containing protein n=1 Tax=Punica granatum TaxID=22663 RepID=A0A2I0KKQ6_PUNGR|nr:hypothetical protein CRG98_010830 [Punica granatum]
MALTTGELLWAKQLLGELAVEQSCPMKLFCDNQAALHIASNSVFHEMTKHIKVDCHFVREKLQSQDIVTIFVNSNDQLTYIFTKTLRGFRVDYICNNLGVDNIYAPARGEC